MRIEYYSNDMIMNFGIFIFFIVFIQLIFLLVVSIKSLFIKKKYPKYEPKISIVIPAYNEEQAISDCLISILKSDYDSKKLEIVCVDDKSTDNTSLIIKKISKKYGEKIKIVKGNHEGKAAALNIGIKKSNYDFILAIDADTVIEKNFINKIIAPFYNKKVGATNGICLIKPNKLIEYFQQVEYFFNNLVRSSFSVNFNNGIWFFGAAACFRKENLEKVGFFKNVLTEDMDMSLEFSSCGFDVLTVNNARYFTRPARNLKELINQRMRWFFGGFQSLLNNKRAVKRSNFAVKYLFFNQFWWGLYSFIIFPLIIYQVLFWIPNNPIEIFWYLFRWFSLFGPIYVLYKIPVWGLSFINIFGVSSGIISTIINIISVKYFRGILNPQKVVVLIFYFPYTLLMNFIVVLSIIKYYILKRKKYFLK